MKVSVIGLGYVGCVSAACLARDMHEVIGVDINPQKLGQLRVGKSPIIEPGLDNLIKDGVELERLAVTSDTREAVKNSQASLICVGTPSRENGSLNLDFVRIVTREIGSALQNHPTYHTVIVRSTVLPGTVRNELLPILESESGKVAGRDFGLCMNPEFLREGTAIEDYYNPAVMVIGQFNERSGDAVEELYENIEAEIIRSDLETAEMAKYANNAFHALKVSFANEIGNFAKANGVDGRKIMDILCSDNRLNISASYLKPGFAFGGSCLPKDMRAMMHSAKQNDLSSPLLESILPSNEEQIRRGIRLVEETKKKKLAVLGLSFKAGTDDVRESPTVALIETLVGKGYQVKLYDETIRVGELIGANKSFLYSEIPHITSLMSTSVEDALDGSEVVVLANNSPAFADLIEKITEEQTLIDLVGRHKINGNLRGKYEGICW